MFEIGLKIGNGFLFGFGFVIGARLSGSLFDFAHGFLEVTFPGIFPPQE